MDHFLEEGREFGQDLDLLLGREFSPEITGLGGHRASPASATESSSTRADKVSLVEVLGWAEARVVAWSGICKAINSR